MPRLHSGQPGITDVTGRDNALDIRLNDVIPQAPAEQIISGGCVSNITGVTWLDASINVTDHHNPTDLGITEQRVISATSQRPLGPWSMVGIPIGDICPDCVLTWALTNPTGSPSIYWQATGGLLFVGSGLPTGLTTSGAVTPDVTFIWTLSVNCPDSGQSGTVGTLTLTTTTPD